MLTHILREFLLAIFLLCLALQGWRGLFSNTLCMIRCLVQDHDLNRSQISLKSQNQKMRRELEEIRQNPQDKILAQAKKQLDLVQDPHNEIVLRF